MTGKPYPDVTLTIKNTETNKEVNAKTDAKGHYSAPGLAGGTYNIDLTARTRTRKTCSFTRRG